ncbi:hypothetical protein D3C77_584750 [compost metagenome]
MLRRAELLLHLQRIFVPVRVLAVDIAQIVLIPRRRRGAARQDRNHQHQRPHSPLFHPSPQQKKRALAALRIKRSAWPGQVAVTSYDGVGDGRVTREVLWICNE